MQFHDTSVLAAWLVEDLLEQCAHRKTVIRMGIDGPSAVGKTTLAQAIVQQLQQRHLEGLHLPLDHFHHPAEHRYRKGRDTVEGYVEDSFDLHELRDRVLAPLDHAPPGTALSWHPRHLGVPRPAGPSHWTPPLGQTAILVVEGVMLLRPPLMPHFDYTVHLTAEEEVLVGRGIARDAARLDGVSRTEDAYRKRYLPGQRRYKDIHTPHLSAHQVLQCDPTGFWSTLNPDQS